MDVAQATQPLFSGTAAANASDQSVNSISSDFETFLQMLTVQMQNQDPLNPIDSTDYAVQLATFSSVEQQVLTNDLLENLSAQTAATNMASLAQWVGMDAKAGNVAQYSGQTVKIDATSVSGADRLILNVTSASGQHITRQDIPLRGGDLTWDGRNNDGSLVEHGAYSMTIEAYSNGDLISTAPAEVFNTIKEVRLENGQTELVIGDNLSVASTEVTSLRRP